MKSKINFPIWIIISSFFYFVGFTANEAFPRNLPILKDAVSLLFGVYLLILNSILLWKKQYRLLKSFMPLCLITFTVGKEVVLDYLFGALLICFYALTFIKAKREKHQDEKEDVLKIRKEINIAGATFLIILFSAIVMVYFGISYSSLFDNKLFISTIGGIIGLGIGLFVFIILSIFALKSLEKNKTTGSFSSKTHEDKYWLSTVLNYRFTLSSLLGRIMLTGILSIVFGLIAVPFMQSAEGRSFEEMARIGGINMWRFVVIYGLLTLSVIVFSFSKKRFRLTAIFLSICWMVGSFFVLIISTQNKQPANTTFSNSTLNGGLITDRSQCDENKALDEGKWCTVTVMRDDGGHGTGFSIQKGFLITNKHVIEGANKLTTWLDGEKELKVWNYSPTLDIAILKLPEDIPVCQWFDSSQLQMAESLYAIGWPVSPTGDSTITKGIFSRLNIFEDGLEFVQTDASINPGNSGGPLVNKCGVIGVNTLKEFWTEEQLPRPLEGLGNALSSKLVSSLAEELIKDGKEMDVPQSTKKYQASSPYVPDNTPSLDVIVIRRHLERIRTAKESWNNCPNCPNDQLERLRDSLTRQIMFCETLVQRLESGKPTSKDDLFMWDSVVKMSYESVEMARKLNSR